MCHDILTDA